MLAPAERPLEWAARHSPERIVAVGVLALRIRRYQSESAPLGLASIPGLRVTVRGHAERPLWHESTGLYGFLRLPPDELRVEVADPAGRFQAQAVLAQVPDRGAVQEALEAGAVPAPGSAKPLILDIALRPAIGMALPPGTSAVWGVGVSTTASPSRHSTARELPAQPMCSTPSTSTAASASGSPCSTPGTARKAIASFPRSPPRAIKASIGRRPFKPARSSRRTSRIGFTTPCRAPASYSARTSKRCGSQCPVSARPAA